MAAVLKDDSQMVSLNLTPALKHKAGKGKNFRPEEERQLARSVINISQDPVVGNGQKGTAFWERIFQHYNERRPFDFRPARSLESKWGLIKHDVAKFIGVLQQCQNLNSSGTSAADVQRKALELYRLKAPKNIEFAYLHVWEIVKDVPQWNVGCSQEKNSIPVLKRKHVPGDSDSTLLEPSSSTDGGGRSTSMFIRARPQGSKHAKEERRVTALRESAAFAQATATKALADATFKKTKIMEDQNLLMLMTHLTDGVISETGAKYLKLRQEEELEKLETRLAQTRARKTSVQHSPPPIPVETVDALQQRVAAALGTSTRSHAQQRSADAGLPMGGSEDNLGDPLPSQADLAGDGATAAAVRDSGEGLHGSQDDPNCELLVQPAAFSHAIG